MMSRSIKVGRNSTQSFIRSAKAVKMTGVRQPQTAPLLSMASQNNVRIANPKDNAGEIAAYLKRAQWLPAAVFLMYLKMAHWLHAAVYLFHSRREQWLRAAVLGAMDGLVSISSLIMGIGAVKQDSKVIILTGLAGLCAGTCSMAIGEFVSVYLQLDIERAQMEKESKMAEDDEELSNPFQVAVASAFAFSMGAAVPLLAAGFITNHSLRLVAVVAATIAALAVLGRVGAAIGGTRVLPACARILGGGCLAMLVTIGVTKLLKARGLNM